MGLAEQQDCIDQVSLLHTKLNHLEETLKIEEQEKKLRDKLESHRADSAKEAEVLARKEQENASEEIKLQEEEGLRKKLVKKMVAESGSDLAPVTKVLLNLEGNT